MTQTKDWSGLELGRLAMFTMTPAVPNEHFHANIPPIDVFAVSSYPAENSTAFLVLAKQRLAHLPKRTSDGLIVVPDRERRQLEESLEAVANFLAISHRCRRQISSTTPSVDLLPHTDAAREWLADALGFKNDSPSSVMSVVHPHDLVEQHFTQLADRLDGVSLLAEALAHSHPTGRFHELMRLFERAFRVPSRKLDTLLSQFLLPGFGYSSAETRQWCDVRDPERPTRTSARRWFSKVTSGQL